MAAATSNYNTLINASPVSCVYTRYIMNSTLYRYTATTTTAYAASFAEKRALELVHARKDDVESVGAR